MKRTFIVLIAVLLALSCYPGSDSESFNREWEKDRKRRIAGMREATQVTAEGRRVEGEALRALVSGRTHVFEYETTPDGRHQRYVEQTYFSADGRLVYLNNLWALKPREGDRWRVDGRRLCIVNQAMSPGEQCFTLAVLPDARVQYYVAQPGDQTDGLLTKVTNAVHEGEPKS